MEKWHETCKRNPVSGLNWTILYHPRSKCPGHSGRCRGSTCRVFPLCRCAKLVPLTENWVPLRRANVKSGNKPLGFHNFCKAPARPPANYIHIDGNMSCWGINVVVVSRKTKFRSNIESYTSPSLVMSILRRQDLYRIASSVCFVFKYTCITYILRPFLSCSTNSFLSNFQHNLDNVDASRGWSLSPCPMKLEKDGPIGLRCCKRRHIYIYIYGHFPKRYSKQKRINATFECHWHAFLLVAGPQLNPLVLQGSARFAQGFDSSARQVPDTGEQMILANQGQNRAQASRKLAQANSQARPSRATTCPCATTCPF